MYRGVLGVCFATVLFVCGASGYPIAPDAKPPANGVVTLTDAAGQAVTTVQEGGSLIVRGAGYLASSNLTVAMYSSPTGLAELTTDATGAFSVRVTVPKGNTGAHTISAIGLAPDRTARVLEASFQVAPVATTPAQLVRTGVNVTVWTAGALVLIVSGLVLVRTAAMRRRFLPVA